MVEVFKTNVTREDQALMLLSYIHQRFAHYQANFDLSDCDHILRVKSITPTVDACALIALLRSSGFSAEVLPDECSPAVYYLAS